MARLKAASSRRYWPISTSAGSCWRGTNTDNVVSVVSKAADTAKESAAFFSAIQFAIWICWEAWSTQATKAACSISLAKAD